MATARMRDGPIVYVELAAWFRTWFAGYRQRVDGGMEPDVEFVHFMIQLGTEVRSVP